MVLATDMSLHFQDSLQKFFKNFSKNSKKKFRKIFFSQNFEGIKKQVKTMKKSLSNMKSMDKGAVMSFIVHSADISHPTKTWELHERWTAGLVEEFFRQGDAEKERGKN